MVYNLKMLGKKINRQLSEKAVLDEETWEANKNNLSPNYLPICHVNRTFVKLLKKKCQQQTSHFSASTATGLNDKRPKFGKDKEEDLLWIRFKVLPIVFISVLTFIKTQGNNPSIALATYKVWHKMASLVFTQTKTNRAAIAHLHLWNLKIWRVHISSCFRGSWRRKLPPRLSSLLKPCQKRSSSCDFTLCATRLPSTSSKYRRLELKAMKFWPWKSIAQQMPKLCCRIV